MSITHRTVELLRRTTPDFVAPDLWPPNSPDLNPVDYVIWSIVLPAYNKAKKYKNRSRFYIVTITKVLPSFS